MRKANQFGRSLKATVAGIALIGSLLVSGTPALAETAPDVSTMDRTIVGSGSDTTYDLMMALDKIYNAANGCATIWSNSASQPINGQCDTSDTASGNGPDRSKYPWVNDSHAVIKQLYPVGSGNGQTELCKQDLAAARPVDFARSSSGPASGSSAEKCSDLKYIAYAIDAVTWHHFLKNPDGSDTVSANIHSITQDDLKKIFRGEYTLWSELNNKAKDKDGNFITDLPATGIVRYTAQSNSGTFSYWTNSSRTNSVDAMKTPAASPVPSQTAAALYTTVQENNPQAIVDDQNTNNAIYFMSVGRYRQLAGITGDTSDTATSYSGKSTGIDDALGAVNGIAPSYVNIQKSEIGAGTGKFLFSRRVYNVTRYASSATDAYVGANGFLCTATDSTKDRVKLVGYRTLINSAINAEGFVPIPEQSGSYCRTQNPNVGITPNDQSAPTITLATPSPSAGADGKATFKVSFNEGARAVDATKLTVTQAGNANLSYTVSATNTKGAALGTVFDATSTNNLDPYANKLLSTLTISVSNIAYGNSDVVVNFAAGAVADRAGNSSAATSFSTPSNTTEPDTVAPTVSGVSSVVSGKRVWTLTFSEPVRQLDLTDFSYVRSANAAAPVALPSASPVYTCRNSDSVSVPCSWAANTAANDPSGALAIKTLVIATGQASSNNVGVVIDAGAFRDNAGNQSVATSVKDALTAVADTGTWDTDTSTAAASRTIRVWGSGNVVVKLASGSSGGVATVTVDGTLYDTGETATTVGTAKGVNLYAATSGEVTVTVPVNGTGWHTVKITNVVVASAANATGNPSKRRLTDYVAAVKASLGGTSAPGQVATKYYCGSNTVVRSATYVCTAAVNATFATGKTVTIKSVTAQ